MENVQNFTQTGFFGGKLLPQKRVNYNICQIATKHCIVWARRFPEGCTLGKSLWLRPYFTVYPSSRPKTDTIYRGQEEQPHPKVPSPAVPPPQCNITIFSQYPQCNITILGLALPPISTIIFTCPTLYIWRNWSPGWNILASLCDRPNTRWTITNYGPQTQKELVARNKKESINQQSDIYALILTRPFQDHSLGDKYFESNNWVFLSPKPNIGIRRMPHTLPANSSQRRSPVFR